MQYFKIRSVVSFPKMFKPMNFMFLKNIFFNSLWVLKTIRYPLIWYSFFNFVNFDFFFRSFFLKQKIFFSFILIEWLRSGSPFPFIRFFLVLRVCWFYHVLDFIIFLEIFLLSAARSIMLSFSGAELALVSYFLSEFGFFWWSPASYATILLLFLH